MNTAVKEQPRTKAGGTDNKDSSASAGLFVHRSGDKPLPLSGNRFVVPTLPFRHKKNHANKTSSATILRKTGNHNAAFSDEGRGLSGDEDAVADAWICAHCSSKNHTRKRDFCTICKQPKEEKVPIARRGRRQQRDNSNMPALQARQGREGGAPQSSSSSPRRSITAPGSSRSWSPPPVAQRHAATSLPPQQQQHMNTSPAAPPRQQQPPTVVPMNPFDALTQAAPPHHHQHPPVVSPSPSYNNSNISAAPFVTPDQTSRTGVVAVETVDSSDSDEEFYSPPPKAATSPYQPTTTTTTLPSPTHSAQSTPQQQQQQGRASSPAFSCTTSVDTPVHSNRRQDPFAPYSQPKTNAVLRPIESQGSDVESSFTTQPQFRDEEDPTTSPVAQDASSSHSALMNDHTSRGGSSSLHAPQPKDEPDQEERQHSGSFRSSRRPRSLQNDDDANAVLPPSLPTLDTQYRPPSAFAVTPQNPFFMTTTTSTTQQVSTRTAAPSENPFAMLQQSTATTTKISRQVQPTNARTSASPAPVAIPVPMPPKSSNKRNNKDKLVSTPQTTMPISPSKSHEESAHSENPDEEINGDEEQGRQDAATPDRKSYEKCVNTTILASGIVLLLAVGVILIYLVVGRGGGESDNDARAILPDVPLSRSPTTAIPTVSPTVATSTLSPSLNVETTTTPQSPSTLSPSEESLPESPPWVLQSAQPGGASGARLGQVTVLSADGTRLAVSDSSGNIQLLDVSEALSIPFLLNEFAATRNATLLSFDMDSNGLTLAAGWSDGTVVVHSADSEFGNGTWKVQDTLQMAQSNVETMSLSLAGNGDRLAVGLIGTDSSAPVHLWMAGNESNPWVFAKTSSRSGTFDAIDVDLSADGTMLAIARRLFMGSSLQNGFVSVLSVDSEGDSLVLSDAGFIPTGRYGARVSLSANGFRLVVSNVASWPGGWGMHIFNMASKRWTTWSSAVQVTQDNSQVTRAFVSGSGTAVAIADDQGRVYLRQQIVTGNSLVWVTAFVTEDETREQSLQVALSTDGETIAVGHPSYSIDGNEDAGLVQIYRDS